MTAKITITESDNTLTFYNNVKSEAIGTVDSVVDGVDIGIQIRTLLQVIAAKYPNAGVSDAAAITLYNR